MRLFEEHNGLDIFETMKAGVLCCKMSDRVPTYSLPLLMLLPFLPKSMSWAESCKSSNSRWKPLLNGMRQRQQCLPRNSRGRARWTITDCEDDENFRKVKACSEHRVSPPSSVTKKHPSRGKKTLLQCGIGMLAFARPRPHCGTCDTQPAGRQ
jgi:hypothetical protein